MSKKPTVLMVLDGFGISETKEGNAVALAETPNYDKICAKYPNVKGYASGLDVGLPEGQMGNSEVGHLNIGAGRIVYQELTRITKSIKDGDFFKDEILVSAMENAANKNSAIHFFGLLSDGGVHSHNEHLYALVEMAKKFNLEKVYVHCILDGRDTPPSSGKDFIFKLEEQMRDIGVGKVASVSGRYYALDRDKNFDRVEHFYNAMVNGKGETFETSAACIEHFYKEEKTDEFVTPSVIVDETGKPLGTINPEDSVVFFNFRPDRAREITRALVDTDFPHFDRKKDLKGLKFVCFTEYDVTIENKEVVFKPQKLTNTLGEYLASKGLKQLRTAETEKYAHVTFFFNGGVEAPNEGEDRELVDSPKVATYDLKPEMSAYELTELIIKKIKEDKYDLIIVNYANPDMVGHTGIIPAAIKAVEAVDDCLGKVLDVLLEVNGQMFICADHGNSDKMIDTENGGAFTAHTTNPVPFILINHTDGVGLKENGKLADIAPTLLAMMDIEKPAEMTGESLLV